ncbi:MAG: aa3-type cytochrome c oxidase subunit IV [Alphaproteobacteria bacterium]|nr:aa3-type cytochrome c oxidase subunit IV [Alphaproteobacteria bacterium]MCW5752302.1 aa3-type cytochrome c oxidase subunit IV [Alphaproteobacteria bacterium]
MDIRQNRETWAAFVKLTVYGSAAVIVALILMAIFLL